MFSGSLEVTLNNIFQRARSQHAKFVSVEHLLLGLLDDARCRDVLVSSGADIVLLSSALENHVSTHISKTGLHSSDDVQPSSGFQRIIQQTIFEIQNSKRRHVDGIDLLVTLLRERDSSAIDILREHGADAKDLLSAAQSLRPSPRSEIEQRLDTLESTLHLAIKEFDELAELVRSTQRSTSEE